MAKTTLSITNPSPKWATYIFRIVLLLGTTLNTAIVQAPGLSESMKLTIVYWSGIIVTLIWGISRIIGVKIDDEAEKAADVVGDGTRPGKGNG